MDTKEPDTPEAALPPASDEDLSLLARLRARDRTAFAVLLDRYHGPLLRMARMYVATQAVAEEVVQETWLGVITGLPNFEGRSTLKTWLFRILTNRAKTRGEREARSVPFSMIESEEDVDPAVPADRFRPNEMWAHPPADWDDGTPERLLGDKQAVARVMQIVDALPERQRIVLTLRDIEGFDSEEVRNILGLSETNQRVLLHRARSKVRNELEGFLAEALPSGASRG